MVSLVLFKVGQWTEYDLMGAFYRSLVVCDEPIPQGESSECPRGSYNDNGVCKPVPKESPTWSGSEHCYDQSITFEQAIALGGQITMVNVLFGVFGNAIVGTMFIDSWGRKPMMIIAFCGFLFTSVMFSLACMTSHTLTPTNKLYLVLGAVVASVFNCFSAASTAMAVDGTPPNSSERNSSLVKMNVAGTAGTITGFVGGFFILASTLTDYTQVWQGVCVMITIFIFINIAILRETKPAPKEAADILEAYSEQKACGKVCHSLCLGYRIIRADPILRRCLMIDATQAGFWFAADVLCRPWAIYIAGHSPAIASLTGIVMPLFIILGSFSSTCFERLMGQWWAWFFGMSLCIIGMAITTVGGYYEPDIAAPLYWIGNCVVQGYGLGVAIPPSRAILTSRVEDQHQGKVQSVWRLVDSVVISFMVFYASNVILNDPNKVQEQLVTVWWYSVVGMSFTFAGFLYVYCFFSDAPVNFGETDELSNQS